MKLKRNSLITKVWLYLIIFSISILLILWFVQVIFFNTYYEHKKLKDIEKIASNIKKNYKNNDFIDLIDDLSFDKGVCIEVVDEVEDIDSSNMTTRGCMPRGNVSFLEKYKKEFINSSLKEKSYRISDGHLNNSLLYAIKLDDDYYVFVNVSLAPSGWVTEILRGQLFYITIIILILSLIIAYFISKKISNPIIKINNAAKRMSNGEYDVVFSTGESIDEINELSNTLSITCDELSKTEALRRELMANVSHDLKTPLTMIKAYAEMVRDITYKDKKKRTDNLNVIIEETDRLNNLVNDILDLSKMQSNVMEINYTEFNLHQVIKDIIKRFNYLEEQDVCHFIYENKNDLIIKADKVKLEQVIYNLIGNATNYVGEDKLIIIKVILTDIIRIEIIDHGKGIDKKDLNLIWDKYYKLDKTYKRNQKGTGLGLSIVKNILLLHNYNYGVISEKGNGTTFYFEIPRK